MILTCPSCETRFSVADDALGAMGRTVRCGTCRHQWFESPGGDAFGALAYQSDDTEPETDFDSLFDTEPSYGSDIPASSQHPDDASEAPLAEDEWDSEDAPRPAAPALTAAPAFRPRQRSSGWLGWTAVASVVVAMSAAAALLADLVIEVWPPSKRLYAMAGLPFAAPGEGLEMRNITARIEPAGDGTRLVIEGNIVNVSREVRPVPLVRVVLRDDRRDLASWRFLATDVNMIPNENVSFTTFYDRVPASATGAALGFSSAPVTNVPVPERAAARE